jgi:hypothetical protein
VFCGPGCGLSAVRFTSQKLLEEVDLEGNRVRFAGVDGEAHVDGRLRFMAGPQTGLALGIIDADGDWLVLDRPLVAGTLPGTRTELREVQRALRSDIDALDRRLKVINIGLIPALVVLFAIILGLARRSRMGAGRSPAQ